MANVTVKSAFPNNLIQPRNEATFAMPPATPSYWRADLLMGTGLFLSIVRRVLGPRWFCDSHRRRA